MIEVQVYEGDGVEPNDMKLIRLGKFVKESQLEADNKKKNLDEQLIAMLQRHLVLKD